MVAQIGWKRSGGRPAVRGIAVAAATLAVAVAGTGAAAAGSAEVTLVAVDVGAAPASDPSPPRARLNFVREAPDGSGRLFVNDMRGTLYAVESGIFSPWLDLAAEFPALKTAPGLGLGFVSFAFDPEFASNGLFYTAHTESAGAIAPNLQPALPSAVAHHAVVTEWTAADPAAPAFSGSRRELMRIAAAHHFHNVGEIAFNPLAGPGAPDYRLLYICGGDYGAVATGQPGQLQRLDTVWGAVLRIDPNGGPFQRGGTTYGYGIPPDNPFVDGDPDTFDEIFVYGVRNMHRLVWDPGTGALYGTDVGQGNFEEIDLLEPGANYGWPLREGPMALDPVADPETVFPLPPDDATLGFRYPVAVYDHGSGSAIAGGIAYRGAGLRDLAGKFLFGDIVSGALFEANLADLAAADDGDPATLAPVRTVDLRHDGDPATLLQIVRAAAGDPFLSRVDLRFGIDAGGEPWITTKDDGFLRRLVATAGAGPGRTPSTLRVERLGTGDLRLSWNAPACPGAGDTDFAIYEGALGDWTGAEPRTCTDAEDDRAEILTAEAGDRFFLVVPLDAVAEGSFGLDSAGAERPQPPGACRTVQDLTCL